MGKFLRSVLALSILLLFALCSEKKTEKKSDNPKISKEEINEYDYQNK